MKLAVWEDLITKLEVDKSSKSSTYPPDSSKMPKQWPLQNRQPFSRFLISSTVRQQWTPRRQNHPSRACMKYKLTLVSSVQLTLSTKHNLDSDDNEVLEKYLLSNSFKIFLTGKQICVIHQTIGSKCVNQNSRYRVLLELCILRLFMLLFNNTLLLLIYPTT